MSRHILPSAPSPEAESTSPASPVVQEPGSATSTRPTYAKRGKITIVACVPCRKRKTKCDGRRPQCGQCASRDGECHYDMTSDQRRLTYLRDHSEQLQERQNILESLLRTMQNSSEEEAKDILRRLRSGTDILLIAEQVQAGQVLYDVSRPKFSDLGSSASVTDTQSSRGSPSNGELFNTFIEIIKTSDFTVATEMLRRVRMDENIASILRSARSGQLKSEPLQKVARGMPPSIEADFALQEHTFGLVKGATATSVSNREQSDFRSPSDPLPSGTRRWTNVINDSSLLEHLVNLYFTWQHSFFQNFHEKLFRADFASGRSKYCSSSLVNAICAAACFLSNRDQVRVDRNEGSELVSKFTREAKESLEGSRTSIPATAATYLISYVEGTRGKASELWMLGGRSVLMAVELNLHLQFDTRQASKPSSTDEDATDEKIARTRAFWGCFHLCQLTSFTLGRISMISSNSITVELPPVDPAEDEEPWEAYEIGLPDRPGAKASTFHHAASLSKIVNSTLTMFFAPSVPLTGALLLEEHQKYLRWHQNLPTMVSSTSKAPPHVLCLNMYYHAAIVQLFRPFLKAKIDNSNVVPRDVCRQAAQAISGIWQEHRSLYGLWGIYMFQIQCLLTAATVHIVDIPAIASTTYLTQACNIFQDLRTWNGWALSSLEVLRTLAEKWKMVLPREVEEALYRDIVNSPPGEQSELQGRNESWESETTKTDEPLTMQVEYPSHTRASYQQGELEDRASGSRQFREQGSQHDTSQITSANQFDLPQYNPPPAGEGVLAPSKRVSAAWSGSPPRNTTQQKRQRRQPPQQAPGPSPDVPGGTDLAPMYYQHPQSPWQQQQQGPASSYLYTPMSAQQAPLLAPVHSSDTSSRTKSLSEERGGPETVQQAGPWETAALQESVEGLTFGDDWRDPFMAFLPSDQASQQQPQQPR